MTLLTAALLSLALQAAPTDAAPPPATADASATPAATPVATPTPDSISSAPADDYGFVAWCRGALSGHMELYKQAKPEMGRLEAEKAAMQDKTLKTPAERAAAKAARAKEAKESDVLDAQQMAAGREYLDLYGKALKAAEDASPTPIHARGVEATAQGYRIWSAARAADDRNRMWSYIMWELPARCETASKALVANSGLLGEAFKAAPVKAEPPSAPAADPAPPVSADPSAPAPAAVSPAEAAPASDPAKAEATAAQPDPAPVKPVSKPKGKAKTKTAPVTPPLRTAPQG